MRPSDVFSTGDLTFHTDISPAQSVHVTSHIVELPDQLLMVDTTMLPPTAQEVAALIQSTGKPVGMALISLEHPDHWDAAAVYAGVELDDAAIDTLLVGHGLPTTKGDLDHMIRYVNKMDAVTNDADTPDDAVAAMKEAYPGQGGEFCYPLVWNTGRNN